MPEPTPPARLQVFLCHSSGDKAEVQAIYSRLQAEKWIYPWLDEEELLPGQDWREEIEKAVEQSHVIVVCLSPDSITKEGFVQREIRVAVDHADYMPEGTIYIIPLKLKPCEPPRKLIRWHWANYYEERGHERLLKALRLRAENLGIAVNTTQAEASVITPAAPPQKQTPPVQSRAEPAVIPPRPPVATPAPKPEQLLRELTDLATTHQRRRDIGHRLNQIGDTRPGVGVRPDGTPDIKWLLVAPGGSLKIKEQTYQVQPFYIAQYPVTYAQYEAFVKAPDGFNNPEWWQGMPEKYQRQKLDNQSFGGRNNPRDDMSWYQSVAFSRWLDRRLQGLQLSNPDQTGGNDLLVGRNAQVRLPLEWEWQWAAQNGGQTRKYPWGEWQEGYANTSEAGLKRAVAVGMYPQGAAQCGALDMSGNLWEWCLNKYSKPKEMGVDDSTNDRVLRGGAFYYIANSAVCAFRFDLHPNGHDFNFGFRVVGASPIAPL